MASAAGKKVTALMYMELETKYAELDGELDDVKEKMGAITSDNEKLQVSGTMSQSSLQEPSFEPIQGGSSWIVNQNATSLGLPNRSKTRKRQLLVTRK